MVEQIVIGKKYKTALGQVVQVVSGDVLNGEVSSLKNTDMPKIMFLECSVLLGEGGTVYLLNTQVEEID